MRLLLFILLLVVCVMAGVAVARDPGYLLIVYRGTSIEMPLWLGVMGGFLGLYTLYLSAYVVRHLWAVPGGVKSWFEHSRMQRMRRRTVRGYLALLEGHWREAERLLVKSSYKWHTAVINYLCAATAADKQGKIAERDEYLRKAHQMDSRAELAIGITQARLQMDSGQWEQSLATLKRLHALTPNHDFILELLQKVLIELKDWNGILEWLPVFKKKKILSDAQYTALCRKAYGGLLMQAQTMQAKKEIWLRIPNVFRIDADILSAYLPALMEVHDMATAESLIRYGLNHAWDDRLVRFYGRVHTLDLDKQIKNAEHWLKKHADDPVLLLALGQLYAAKQIFGQAQELLTHSLRIKPDPEAYWALGHVYESMGDNSRAMKMYESGSKLVMQ